MRRPSTRPSSNQRRTSTWVAAKTSGTSTRTPARRGHREEAAVVQLGVAATPADQLVVLPRMHLVGAAVAGAGSDREAVVVVPQLVVDDAEMTGRRTVDREVVVAEHGQPEPAVPEVPVDVEGLGVHRAGPVLEHVPPPRVARPAWPPRRGWARCRRARPCPDGAPPRTAPPAPRRRRATRRRGRRRPRRSRGCCPARPPAAARGRPSRRRGRAGRAAGGPPRTGRSRR